MKVYSDAINSVLKQFNKDTVINFEKNPEKIFSISSGSKKIDNILSGTGFAKGRIHEIYGNESSGKTTIALQTVAQCQKTGGKCVYIDLERALDPEYCKKNGVNIEDLIIVQPENAEQCFNIMEALIKTHEIDLIIVDSVSAMVPKAELEGDIEDQTIGLHARIMSKGLRVIQTLLEKDSTCIIFINQIREKVGIMFGNNETTSGGRALRFYATTRLEIRRTEVLKQDSNIIGVRSCIKTVKNKLAAPMQKTYVDIYFNKGFDEIQELIDISIENGTLSKKGAWFYCNDKKISCGREELTKVLENDQTLLENIRSRMCT